MGLVHLPTFNYKHQPNVGKYTSPMDGMGFVVDFPCFFPTNFKVE